MRKPYQLASVLVIIILCSWMMDATILDVGSGIHTSDPRNSAGPKDAFAYNMSGYTLNRNTAWNHSLINQKSAISPELIDNADGADRVEEASTSRKPNIATLLLLGYGIVGVVGFWRRTMR